MADRESQVRGPIAHGGSGGITVVENPQLTGSRAAADAANSVANLFEHFRQRDLEKLKLLFEGIKSGYVDPNEAMTQGTEGGGLYKKFFGVEPPQRPRTLVSPGQPAQIMRQGAMQEPEAAGTPAPISPATPESRTQTGGFTPSSQSALQSHVIRELYAGRRVPNELMAASGLTKTLAQQEMYDPSIRERLAHIRADPRRMANMVRLQTMFPDAEPGQLLQWEEQMHGGAAMPAQEGKPALGPSVQQQRMRSREDIAQLDRQSREQTWDKRLQTSRDLQTERLDASATKSKELLDSKNYMGLITHLTPEIGLENARLAAQSLVYGDGSLPASIKGEVDRALARRSDLMDARTEALRSLPGAREKAGANRERALDIAAASLEARITDMTNKQEHRAFNDSLKRELTAVKNLAVDPNQRARASAAFERILHEMGYTAGDPEGLMNIALNRMGSALGMNWGTTPLIPPTRVEPTPAPFNPPRVTPQKPGVVPRGGVLPAPKTMEEFYDRYPNLRPK